VTGARAEPDDNAEPVTIDTPDRPDSDVTPGEPERVKRPGFVYFLGYGIMAPVARVVFRPRILGRENIPATGRVILASNHLSFIDSIVIPLVATRRVQFLAKSTYFTGTGAKGWVSRTFFTAIGAIGVERGAGSMRRAPSPFIRRAPGPSTAASTKAAPGSPGSPSPPGPSWFRWG
jgi:1-acyl-sn-glycerol-3-phosphate acyltransferase